MADAQWKIGDIAGVVALVMAFVAILGGIRKIGNIEQSFKDGLATLEKDHKEDRAAIEKVVSRIEAHVHEASIHINPEMERRAYSETMTWRDRMEAKIEKLLEQGREKK